MAERGDVVVNWALSPRIITVEDPSTEITMQDLHDTMRAMEAQLINLDKAYIISSDGKQPLAGGGEVGITSQLQNAELAFETRDTPLETGTVTTPDSNGKKLIDSAATFVTNNVERGSLVYNETDGSSATVLEVISETELDCDGLSGGTDNRFDASDAYKVFEVEVCTALGGNLSAVDDVGSEITPIFPTFGTQVNYAASSSPTIDQANVEALEVDVTNLKYLMEYLRPGHPATGTTYYWDPFGGNDAFNGLTPARAVLTWGRVLALVTAWNHDTVICMANNPAGITVVTTPINISVPTLIVRGPGRTLRFVPAAAGSPTITISASHVALSEIDVYTAGVGADVGVLVTGADDVRVDTVHVHSTTSHGVQVLNCDLVKLLNLLVDSAGGDGVNVGANVDRLYIDAPDISGCTASGINLAGSPNETTIDGDSRLMDCGGYGLVIAAGSLKTTIGGMVTSINNTFGDIGDNGTDTFYTGSFIGGNIKSNIAAIKAIEYGRWKIVGTQMRFYDEDNVTEVARFDLKNQAGTPVDVSQILVHDRIKA